jgi:hypothetical protein
MKRAILATLVVACVVAVFAANAQAMYNPQLGRFMQRDPVGYVDGMNLYEFGKSRVIQSRDSLGLACNVTRHRGDKSLTKEGKDVGHEWLRYPGGSMEFYPTGSFMFWTKGEVQMPDHDGVESDKTWSTTRIEEEDKVLEAGDAKGLPCKCANCNQIISCLESYGREYKSDYSLVLNNCRSFVAQALSSCCLKSEVMTQEEQADLKRQQEAADSMLSEEDKRLKEEHGLPVDSATWSYWESYNSEMAESYRRYVQGQ